jgi:hypothetical protein
MKVQNAVSSLQLQGTSSQGLDHDDSPGILIIDREARFLFVFQQNLNNIACWFGVFLVLQRVKELQQCHISARLVCILQKYSQSCHVCRWKHISRRGSNCIGSCISIRTPDLVLTVKTLLVTGNNQVWCWVASICSPKALCWCNTTLSTVSVETNGNASITVASCFEMSLEEQPV